MSYLRFVSVFLVLFASLAAAESRWVTDEFEVMMRSGKSTQQSIIRQLKSGTQVELVEVDPETGYSLVRLPSGTEGWVLTRYLISTPTAKQRLPEIEARLKARESQGANLNSELRELTQAKQTLEREVGELQSRNSSLQDQLDRITQLSSETIKVDQQNKQLNQRLAESEAQIVTLQAENNRLASRGNREWFLVGGAVLAAGLLLGLIIPRISWRKKSSWSDF